MAYAEVVAQERPDERVDVVDLAGEILLHLVQLAMPRPARHLNDAELLAVYSVGEGTAPTNLLECGPEPIGELGIDLLVLRGRNVQRERLAHRRQSDVRVVEYDGADLHHLLPGAPDAELATPVEQRFVGADEHALAVVELGRQRLPLGVTHRGDPVLSALRQHLLDELVRGGEIEHGLAGFVHHRLSHQERNEGLAAAREALVACCNELANVPTGGRF